MKCDEMRERIPDVAAGLIKMNPGESQHVAACAACAGKLAEFRQTMALLDEWPAPEPSPYFDMRLQARLREETAKPQAGWLQWFRRPVLAAALTLLMGVGVGLFFVRGWEGAPATNSVSDNFAIAEPGTAVGDLQALDSNHDQYSDFELLDDLQPDVVDQ
ncbi:MAG TPA: hypothetical protein VIW68_04570 [Candidatus Sulfotelmatobacter sp.]